MDNNVGSNGNGGSGWRIPRHSLPHFKLDSLFDESLDHLPHLSQLVQCYRSDWIEDDNKYGHYESISPVSFQNQIFEGPDADIETEMQLTNERQIKAEDATDDDIPSSSGRQFTNSNVTKHFGQSPLPAYEPAFDWGNERSMIFGQRIPETPTTQYGSGLNISVKVLSPYFQAGLVEPFYGTICIYNRERREKLSEDFYFSVLPSEMQDAKVPLEPHGIFYLDAPSTSICLLIQLEKPATEEGGVTPSVYSCKEPPLTLSLSRKRNLFIRVELRKDDADARRQPLEAVHLRERVSSLQKCAHTQVAVGTRVACYHDEIKVSLPAVWTPLHHLLFTFFHVDLQTKLEAPKPVVIGYASLPLSTHAQLRSEISLPVMRELVPHYLMDSGKERLDYLEDGKSIFKLRLRLCSSVYPINECIISFLRMIDTLRTSPLWGFELLEDNVDRTLSFVVLINLLCPLDPSRWPSPATNDLVFKCFIKLTKGFQKHYL